MNDRHKVIHFPVKWDVAPLLSGSPSRGNECARFVTRSQDLPASLNK